MRAARVQWVGSPTWRRLCRVLLAATLAGPFAGPAIDGLAASPDAALRIEADIGVGNPLAHIPIDELRQTRERPLFSPARRPPPPPAPAPVAAVEPPPPPSPPAPPEPPNLTLLGVAVTSKGGGVAVLFDGTTREVVRLKLGERRRGWLLDAIKGRTIVLRKDQLSASLAITALPSAPPPDNL